MLAYWTAPCAEAATLFLSLAAVANPPGCAMIFAVGTCGASRSIRRRLAWRIARNVLLLLLATDLVGARVLRAFGLSLASLQLAGGALVAAQGWIFAHGADAPEDSPFGGVSPSAALLTFPFSVGPGTLALILAYPPSDASGSDARFLAVFLASAALAATIGLCYAGADGLLARFGARGAQILGRVSGYLLLCIGLEIALAGARAFLRSL
jgi:multiple antibiotic resistance protein